MSLREDIIALAKKQGADIVGFAPVGRFDKDDEIFKIMPETKTVIGFAFRVLRGIYRGVEEGTTYYQYSTMGVECIEETLGYELPSGWTFTTIGMICSLQAGKFVSAADISPVCLDNMYPCYGGLWHTLVY